MTGSAEVGRFAAWFWRRNRQRFFVAVGAFAVVVATVAVMVPASAWISITVDLTFGQAVAVGAAAFAISALGIIVSFTSQFTEQRAITAWVRGDQSDPIGVWNASLQAARVSTQRGVAVQLPLQLVITGPLIAVMGDLGLAQLAVAELCIVGAEIAGALAIGLSCHLLLRPLQLEVEPHLPLGSVPVARAWTVRARFLAAIGAGSFCVAMLSFAATSLADTEEDRFALTGAFALVIAGYLVLLARAGIVDPTLRPLHDLIEATNRVRLGDYATRVPISTADEFGALAAGFNEMQHGLLEREALHAAFGSYVDPALAQRLLDSGSSMFDGEEVELTVLFADVRDFTGYAEGVEPAEAVALLNRLFDIIVPLVHAEGGHANHYLGDGLLAVFGAPQSLDRHADAAVTAAIEVQRRVRRVFGDELRLGIGINSGPVIAGTVGGGGRLEFTVIGDTVNVAARVEQLTKDTGDAILITEATWEALSRPRPATTTRGELPVRGKAAGVTLLGIDPFTGTDGEARSPRPY